jgi:ligand-binding sensor domain-containing protein/two-component sensor histidine kinase
LNGDSVKDSLFSIFLTLYFSIFVNNTATILIKYISNNTIILTVFFLIRINCYAQTGNLQFESITSQQGLSQNSGYCIAQTNEGLLWFGTQDGLNCYDGNKITVYKNEDGNNEALCGNNIQALAIDKAENIWVGTSAGLCIFNKVTNQFNVFSKYFKTDSVINNLNTNKIFIDSKGDGWIITAYNGLFKFSLTDKKNTSYFINAINKDKLSGIAEDGNGNIWVSSSDEIFKLTNNIFEPYNLLQKCKSFTTGNTIKDIETVNDEIWVGTSNKGVLRISNPLTAFTFSWLNTTTIPAISNNEITNLYKTTQKNIWIGTRSGGVNKVNLTDNTISIGRYDGKDNFSLQKNLVLSIFEDKQGIAWVGTSGGGFSKYDKNKFQFKTINKNSNVAFNDNMIMGTHYADNTIFLGTLTGGMMVADKNFATIKNYEHRESVNSILQNNVYGFATVQNNVWIATWGGLCSYNKISNNFTSYNNRIGEDVKYLYSIHKLKTKNALLASGVKGFFLFNLNTNTWQTLLDKNNFTKQHVIVARTIVEVDNNELFLGTEENGLIQYNYNSGLFDQNKALYNIVKTARTIVRDGAYLWIGGDNGLVKYNYADKKIMLHLTKKNGLPDNVVYAMLKDDKNKLWYSTNNGLGCYNIATGNFKNYDLSYGLQSLEFNTNCAFKDEDNNFYFGGINGLNVFNPYKAAVDSFAPKVLITEINIMNKPFATKEAVWFTKQLDLNYAQNFVNIAFSMPNFSHSDKNSYRYKLDGVDADWVNVGNKNYAYYTKLEPGSYTFNVQAANSDGVWSKEITQLKINIKPPFYKIWWFYTLCFLCAGSILFALYKMRINNIRKQTLLQKTYEQKLGESEMKVLRSQMNPHFMFNTLNSINSYIIQNKTTLASEYLTTFSKLMRSILDLSKQEKIALSREIVSLKMYLELESLRLENKFDYSISIDQNIDDEIIKIPSLIIQPFVENAIWHGLHNKESKGNIFITIKETDKNNLLITIEDDGIGRQAAAAIKQEQIKHKSYGIDITINRLQLLNNNNSVTFTDLYDENNMATGTKVIIQLNTQYND